MARTTRRVVSWRTAFDVMPDSMHPGAPQGKDVFTVRNAAGHSALLWGWRRLVVAVSGAQGSAPPPGVDGSRPWASPRSEEHTSELQSRGHLVCRLLLEKKEQRVEACSEWYNT